MVCKGLQRHAVAPFQEPNLSDARGQHAWVCRLGGGDNQDKSRLPNSFAIDSDEFAKPGLAILDGTHPFGAL